MMEMVHMVCQYRFCHRFRFAVTDSAIEPPMQFRTSTADPLNILWRMDKSRATLLQSRLHVSSCTRALLRCRGYIALALAETFCLAAGKKVRSSS